MSKEAITLALAAVAVVAFASSFASIALLRDSATLPGITARAGRVQKWATIGNISVFGVLVSVLSILAVWA